jgi:hypothetical protein
MLTNARPFRWGSRTVLRTAMLLLIGLSPCWAGHEDRRQVGGAHPRSCRVEGAAGADQIVSYRLGHAH